MHLYSETCLSNGVICQHKCRPLSKTNCPERLIILKWDGNRGFGQAKFGHRLNFKTIHKFVAHPSLPFQRRLCSTATAAHHAEPCLLPTDSLLHNGRKRVAPMAPSTLNAVFKPPPPPSDVPFHALRAQIRLGFCS
ncbi:hypothetical protein CEXT_4251 [Caerostris extrusa]|uniref:Uncharacterized protein n=1 Tax=Caerostris extrusa TaxID=172846 RepID=A0AAV4N816_CAEEX|nr:hypothetical protein CEXT_4251 [Caerostris extrusa]